MTDGDWQSLEDLLAAWWPGEFSVARRAAYRLALDRFEAARVAKALGVLLERGGRFRPAASEIVALLVEGAASRPSADEAWALIEEAIRRLGRSIYAVDFDERHEAAIAWLAERDVVLGAYANRRGLAGRGTLGCEPIHDPEFGGAVRGRLAKDWTAAVELAAIREAKGLPPVDGSALAPRRRSVRSGGMAEVVDGLRPVRELEAGEDAA